MKTIVYINVEGQKGISTYMEDGCQISQGNPGNVIFDVTKYEDGKALCYKFAVDWADLKKAVETVGLNVY